jgi:hypothetical protein
MRPGFSLRVVEIDARSYDHDVVIERAAVSRRGKSRSKPYGTPAVTRPRLPRWRRPEPPFEASVWSPSHTLFATSFDDKQRQLTMGSQWSESRDLVVAQGFPHLATTARS